MRLRAVFEICVRDVSCFQCTGGARERERGRERERKGEGQRRQGSKKWKEEGRSKEVK